MNYINIEVTNVPGVSVRTGAAYAETGGQYFPVTAVLPVAGGGYLPVLDIPQMSDERWQELCRRSFLRRYEAEHGTQQTFPEEAYWEYNAQARKECGLG